MGIKSQMERRTALLLTAALLLESVVKTDPRSERKSSAFTNCGQLNRRGNREREARSQQGPLLRLEGRALSIHIQEPSVPGSVDTLRLDQSDVRC